MTVRDDDVDFPAGRDSQETPPPAEASPAVATAGPPGPILDPPPAAEHPIWCAPDRCTARQAPPFDQYVRRQASYGRHESAPVDVYGALTLQVTQQVAEWNTATYLRIEDRVSRDLAAKGVPYAAESSLEVGDLGRALGKLRALPTGPITEPERVEARRLAETARILDPDHARVAGRYLADTVRSLIEDEPDPIAAVQRLRQAYATHTVLAGEAGDR